MILLSAVSVGRIFGGIGAVFGGLVLGAIIAVWYVVWKIRQKVKTEDFDYDNFAEENEKQTIERYVKNCEKSLEQIIRKKTKENRKSAILKKIKERREQKRKSPIEPPDDDERPVIEFDKAAWYPVYLMLHNIGVYYRSEEPLSFLDVTEKELFSILRKISHAVAKTLDNINIDALKKIKCYTLLETMNVIMSVVEPLNKRGVLKGLKYSKEGYTDVMKVKSALSLNPFYYIRRFINRRITLELTVECVKYAVDILAAEIIDLYKN